VDPAAAAAANAAIASAVSAAASAAPPRNRLGAHVRVDRGRYHHHGIISSADGSHVIHYVKDPANPLRGVIAETNFELFVTSSRRFHRARPAAAAAAAARGHMDEEEEKDEEEEHDDMVDASVSFVEHEEVRFSPKEIVARAREQIGRRDYNLWGSNCEHFATWCHTDRASSEQVHAHGKSLLNAAGTLSWFAAGVGVVALAATVLGKSLVHASNHRS
jgi:hypothetical protein